MSININQVHVRIILKRLAFLKECTSVFWRYVIRHVLFYYRLIIKSFISVASIFMFNLLVVSHHSSECFGHTLEAY